MNLNGSVYLIFFVSLFLIYYENVLYIFILCLYSILFKKDWTIVICYEDSIYIWNCITFIMLYFIEYCFIKMYIDYTNSMYRLINLNCSVYYYIQLYIVL